MRINHYVYGYSTADKAISNGYHPLQTQSCHSHAPVSQHKTSMLLAILKLSMRIEYGSGGAEFNKSRAEHLYQALLWYTKISENPS